MLHLKPLCHYHLEQSERNVGLNLCQPHVLSPKYIFLVLLTIIRKSEDVLTSGLVAFLNLVSKAHLGENPSKPFIS